MRTDPAHARLAALTEELRRHSWATAFADREDFGAWWAALQQVTALAPLFAERERRFGPRRFGQESTVTEREAALRAAGFGEIDTVLQDLDKRLLVAIRA
jgi:hypothetical protein